MSLFYVHWYYGTRGESKSSLKDQVGRRSIYDSTYNEKIANRLKDLSGTELANRYKKVIKSTYGFKTIRDVEDFLKREKEIFQQSGFQQAVDEAFKLVHNAAPFFNKTDEEIAQSLVIDPETQAVKFNSELEKITRKMIQFTNHCTQIMQNEDTQAYLAFLKHYGKDSVVKTILDKMGDSKASVILTKTKEKTVEKEIKQLKNEEKELQSYIEGLNKVTASYDKGQLVKTKEQNMVGYVKSLFRAQATMAGTLIERVFSDVSNVLIYDKLIKNINFPNLKVVHTGDKVPMGAKSGTAFNKYTTDAKISLKVDVPDISISMKRYKDFNEKELPNVSLKNANLKAMLDIMQNKLKVFDNKQRGAFYNIMANHRRHVTKGSSGGGGGAIYTYDGINTYYNKLKKLMLIPAIAGSLTKEDLSTLFLINNKVYSIVDILAHADEASISSSLNKANEIIRAAHRWEGDSAGVNDKALAAERSRKIIETILNTSVSLSLKLSLARIKAIS